jgi:octanoyl-[GcvH]:protein N-octanoyltransferase
MVASSLEAMAGRRTITVARDGFPHPPGLDTAVSRAILTRVGGGELPETLRLHRPSAIVAFGPKDRLDPAFVDAVGAARERGFASVHRLAGGRAAVFHEETIAFSWAIPDDQGRLRIGERFDAIASVMVDAFRSLGVDARVGEVPGEYCPGSHSVNAGGRRKLMGVGQRIVKGAAHVGGVVVVRGSERVRDVLVPVYDALGLGWDPATAGALEDEVSGVTVTDAERAIVEAFAARFDLREGTVDAETLGLARTFEPEHEVVAAATTTT